MNTTAKIFIVTALFAITVGAAYGGFRAGSIRMENHYQRIALARQFGFLDQETLEFVWAESLSIKLPKGN